MNLIKRLEKTAQTLDQMVNFLSTENKDKDEEINRILMINHPLVERLKIILFISYNFYFENLVDVKELLKARGYNHDNFDPLFSSSHYWRKKSNNQTNIIEIKEDIFEADGKLKFIKKFEWNDEWVKEYVENDDDDLPF